MKLLPIVAFLVNNKLVPQQCLMLIQRCCINSAKFS